MPFQTIDDPAKLRRLIDALLMIEADLELPNLLKHFVQEACSLVNARYGALGVLNQTRTGLERFVTFGLSEDEERRIGSRPVGRGVLGRLITDPEPLRLVDLSTHPDSYGVPAHHPKMKSFLGVPVRTRNDVYGNLYLTDKIGATEFSDEDESLACALADAAGIAIENHHLYDRVRTLSVLDDRERIAKDLHDRVIQRVFTVGVTLQGATRLLDREQVFEKISAAVDGLEVIMNEIRSAVYELSGTAIPGGLRQGVLELASELAPILGARPEVNFHGLIDNAVPPRVADNLLAALREILTNAAKHARASHYGITLSVTDEVVLDVVDDGIGFDATALATKGMGLTNLRNRAERLHGTFEVQRVASGGTRVTWRVPLSSSSSQSDKNESHEGDSPDAG